jgi:quercetin dioxygenase-like cupin family protein
MGSSLTGRSLIVPGNVHKRSDEGSGLVDSAPACPGACERRNNMKTLHLHFRAYLVAFLMLAAVPVEAADVKELFAIDLAEYPGKEGRMIEVSYPPGAQDVVHRHDAHAFVYVLEGQIVMQLKGQSAVTLKAGQTFYEGPKDIHVVGRNASSTEPARFVVVLLKDKGAPVLTPVNE